jgi:cob(I)alamin adenosyltransferase
MTQYREVKYIDYSLKQLEGVQLHLYEICSHLNAEGKTAISCPAYGFDASHLASATRLLNTFLNPLKSFVIASKASVEGAQLQVCRTICRRAERCVVHYGVPAMGDIAHIIAYLNRLGDFLFVTSRIFTQEQEIIQQVKKDGPPTIVLVDNLKKEEEEKPE